MTEEKKRVHEYVTEMLHQSAAQRYTQLFGGWKQVAYEQMKIKVPDLETFQKDTERLLPQKYMQGVKGASPNVLYRAILDMDYGKVSEIIMKAQNLSFKEFANRYNTSKEIVQREWYFMWRLITVDYGKRIPALIADDFANWFMDKTANTKQISNNDAYRDVKNQCIACEMIAAYQIVCKCILISSESEQEYKKKFEWTISSKVKTVISNLMQIWSEQHD